MSITPTAFPRELLARPWSERLNYFQTYMMAHPKLVAVREALQNAIHEVPQNSLIFVFGPTGVGKTTLRAKVERELGSEMASLLNADPTRLPVVSVECIAPESGSFSWRDHFRRLLLKMEEPLVDYKINPEALVRTPVVRFMPSAKAVGAEYHHAVERALTFRRPTAVLVDEAQHLARMGSGRRLSDQLDVVKSLANRTKTVHVLIGTYELLAFRNLSGQLSRRSVDIHFRRYQTDDPADIKTFRTILRSFEQQLPVADPPDLVNEWEYLYERTIGCVGVLKDWLLRALVSASRRDATGLTVQDLQTHALSVAQCDKMLAEALAGENILSESAEARNRLRSRLGLSPNGSGQEHAAVDEATSSDPATARRINQPKPGQRRPIRDPVGIPEPLYANPDSI